MNDFERAAREPGVPTEIPGKPVDARQAHQDALALRAQVNGMTVDEQMAMELAWLGFGDYHILAPEEEKGLPE